MLFIRYLSLDIKALEILLLVDVSLILIRLVILLTDIRTLML